jgi:hypothetical protein
MCRLCISGSKVTQGAGRMALKTKRLAKVWYLLANLVTFMKFRGPQALVDNYGYR